VRRLGGDRAGEIRLTRFLRNPSVSGAEMVATAAAGTAARCAGRRVLAIQDTTVVRSAGGGGLYLHPTIAVDADDGAILGLVEACLLPRAGGRAATRKSLPIEDKESRRWLDGAEAAGKVCATADEVTVIADREGDIYAAFAACPPPVRLLVRAAQDRALDDADGGRLFTRLDALAEAGRTVLSLPAKPGRRAREATLAVRFMQADLKRPRTAKPLAGTSLPERVRVTLVDVREVEPREVEPPQGETRPSETRPSETLHWRLLTTQAVEDFETALAIADLYRRRWAIEQLFRTLKTQGFDIEGIAIEAEVALSNLVMATLVAAVIVQQLVHARDGSPHGAPLRPLTDAFDASDQPLLAAFCAKLEGKTQRQKNPHPKGSLAYAAWICARLGGWTGYYGKPGPLVMLAGWRHFRAAKTGLDALARWRKL
jgi:hypothetical protein